MQTLVAVEAFARFDVINETAGAPGFAAGLFDFAAIIDADRVGSAARHQHRSPEKGEERREQGPQQHGVSLP